MYNISKGGDEMLKAYKYRLYPNKEQEIYFLKCFGCVRFIYNKMLNDKIEYYKENHKMLHNTPAQYKKEFEWLKDVDSLALANAQMNLDKAYKNFFRDESVGFPKFKSKKSNHYSYTTNNQNNTIYITDNKYIKLPKLKTLVIGSYCFTEVRNVFIQGLYFLLFIIRFTILKAFRIRTFCFPG